MRNAGLEEAQAAIKIAGRNIKKIYFCYVDYAKVFDYVDDNKLWNILKVMGIPGHLTYLQSNLHAGQETTVRRGHGAIN